MTSPAPQRQELDIRQLVKRIATQRGQPLQISTSGAAATSFDQPATGRAVINGEEVSYDVIHEPARVIMMLLKAWNRLVTINGVIWQPSTHQREKDQLVIHRQRLPLAGMAPVKAPLETIGKPSPDLRALGVEFDVPLSYGYPDYPHRRNIYLSAPDPGAQRAHFGLNLWATVKPRITLSDDAALECRLLAHDDIPYLIPGKQAKAEILQQTKDAALRATEQLEQITGIRGFQHAKNANDAAGTHPAYTCNEDIRINLLGKARPAKMASTGCEDAVTDSFARGLYLDSDAALVPLQGHYGTGAILNVIPRMVRTVRRDGTVREQKLPGRPCPIRQMSRHFPNPERARSISLLVETRPVEGNGPSESHWVETDLMIRGYGPYLMATLSDRFTGNVDDLTDLLVHMTHHYYSNNSQMRPWEQRRQCAVAAHRAMGDEDAAFRTELEIMAMKFLEQQRSQPAADHCSVETPEGAFSWTRNPQTSQNP